jgi:copper chaperone CopZ
MMATATLRVSGVRCERCIGRLAGALRGHEGIEYANANLMGEVTLEWDDGKTSRDEIAAALSPLRIPRDRRRAGIAPLSPTFQAPVGDSGTVRR